MRRRVMLGMMALVLIVTTSYDTQACDYLGELRDSLQLNSCYSSGGLSLRERRELRQLKASQAARRARLGRY